MSASEEGKDLPESESKGEASGPSVPTGNGSDGVTAHQGGAGTKKRQRNPNEDAFWKSYIEASAPGWRATVVPSGQGGIGLAGMETFFYAIDTRTGWVNAAGFPAAQVDRMIEKIVSLEPEPGTLQTTAISKITELGQLGADKDSDDARLVMMSTIGALSKTQTMATARQINGSLKGHFAYLVYTPTHGRPFSRPLFAMPPEEGFMPLDVLFELVGEWMRRDMFTPGSGIYSTIQSAGPLLVCEGLQEIINGGSAS